MATPVRRTQGERDPATCEVSMERGNQRLRQYTEASASLRGPEYGLAENVERCGFVLSVRIGADAEVGSASLKDNRSHL